MKKRMCLALACCAIFLFGCSMEHTGAAPAPQAPLERSSEQEGPAAAGEGSPLGDHREITIPAPQSTPTIADAPVELEVETIQPAQPASPVAPKQEQADVAAETEELFMLEVAPDPTLQRIADGLGLSVSTDVFEVQITHQTEELLSCLVEVEEESGTTTLLPYTYRVQDGAACELGEFFSAADTGWKGLLPDLVTEQAKARGMTLLCEVPPVREDQPYYIDGGSIVLLYRPYEITTYESGTPQFRLDMQAIAEYTTGAYGVGVQE